MFKRYFPLREDFSLTRLFFYFLILIFVLTNFYPLYSYRALTVAKALLTTTRPSLRRRSRLGSWTVSVVYRRFVIIGFIIPVWTEGKTVFCGVERTSKHAVTDMVMEGLCR